MLDNPVSRYSYLTSSPTQVACSQQSAPLLLVQPEAFKLGLDWYKVLVVLARMVNMVLLVVIYSLS
jgi:hypothetical protein